MKEETPLQELINYIEKDIEKYGDNLLSMSVNKKISYIRVNGYLDKCKELLEKEKQLVIDAFVQGNRELFYDGSEEVLANEYFNNKYNTNG